MIAQVKLAIGGALMAAIVMAWLYHGHVKYEEGKASVQLLWDSEKARQKEAADKERLKDEAARKAVEAKHKKDIEYAKSTAGRAAIADWLKSHGLLPDGSPVRIDGDSGQAQGSQSPDDGSGEQRLGGFLEEFAGRCAQDAIKINNFHEWVKQEGLEIE